MKNLLSILLFITITVFSTVGVSALNAPILGICEDYPRGTMYDEIERDFELLAKYDITDLRISIAWGDVEFAKGYFDWWLLDDTVDLAEQYGIELYPYICYAPTWATRETWRSPPDDMADWYDFVYEVVNRYGDRINYWELWNEGDNYEFWVGSWEQQLELVKVGAQAVKDADPEAITVFGGLTNLDSNHIRSIFSSGVADYVDAINIHFYHETWNPTPTEQIYPTVRRIKDVIKESGEQELWVAEIGYSDYVEEDGYVSYYVRTSHPYEKTQHFQAVTFGRQVTQLLASEDVSTVLWYEVKNLPLYSSAIGDVNNHYLGALDFDYFPKPLFFALASFVKLFDNPFDVTTEQIEVSVPNGTEPFFHAFTRENGDTLLIAWKRGIDKVEMGLEGIPPSGTILQYSITGNKTILPTLQSVTLDPEELTLIEVLQGKEARLSLTDLEVSPAEDGYLVRAVCGNIGNGLAESVVVEVFPSKELVFDGNAERTIPSLEPGEEYVLEWLVEPGQEEGGQPRMWIVVRDGETPPAAELVYIQ